MGTKEFNVLDKVIAGIRLSRIGKYVREGDTILDLGCGWQAYLLRHLSDKIKYGLGLDYDVESNKILENVKIMKFDFYNKFPFKDQTFDKVFMLAVLEHMELDKIMDLFREIKRVIKKGGKLILTTPTPASKPLLEFLAFKMHIISRLEVSDHKKYYDEQDIYELAKKSGFEIEIYKKFMLGLNSFCVMKIYAA